MEINRLYILFDLHPDATVDDLKQAYRSKVKKNHPDLIRTADPLRQQLAEERMKEINIAYQQLNEHIKNRPPLSQRSNTATDRPDPPPSDTTGTSHTREQPSRPAYRTTRKRTPMQETKRKINTENNFIAELLRTIWTGLSKLDMKTIFSASPSEAPPPRKKSASTPSKPEDFHDILDEILKGNGNERGYRKQTRRRNPYAQSMKNYGRRRPHGKDHDARNVGGIKPVSRVRKVHRDD